MRSAADGRKERRTGVREKIDLNWRKPGLRRVVLARGNPRGDIVTRAGWRSMRPPPSFHVSNRKPGRELTWTDERRGAGASARRGSASLDHARRRGLVRRRSGAGERRAPGDGHARGGHGGHVCPPPAKLDHVRTSADSTRDAGNGEPSPRLNPHPPEGSRWATLDRQCGPVLSRCPFCMREGEGKFQKLTQKMTV